MYMAKIDINEVILDVFGRELDLGCCVRRDLTWASSEVFGVSGPPGASEAKSMPNPCTIVEEARDSPETTSIVQVIRLSVNGTGGSVASLLQ